MIAQKWTYGGKEPGMPRIVRNRFIEMNERGRADHVSMQDNGELTLPISLG